MTNHPVFRAYAPLVFISACMVGLMLLMGALLSPALSYASPPRAVALEDATMPPARTVYVKPGEARDIFRQCGTLPADAAHAHYFTETSAYTWQGKTLGVQRWNYDHTVAWWGRVSFDGVTVRNHGRRPILFAGWCA